MSLFSDVRWAINHTHNFEVILMGDDTAEHTCALDELTREALGVGYDVPYGTMVKCLDCSRRWLYYKTSDAGRFDWSKFRWVRGKEYGKWILAEF